jgi:lipopolysaccharide transport system ATP-binding protein
MEPIISVRGLGKSYRIQTGERKPYRTLRDDIADFGKGLLKGKWRNSRIEEFWALQDVNFSVTPGEVVGIIGRNGAGKSTLLKLLSRVVQPTTGEAILDGRVGSLLEVGTGFHPELTGRENIFMSGAILGMKRAEIKQKFDEIVDFAEVEKFLDTPVKRYSSGMYVRLAFSVAAHLETEILIVDEVLAVGDRAFQKKCLGQMKDVASGGRTILFVSHNMQALSSLCYRSILLDRGTVVADGKTDEMLALYTHHLRKTKIDENIGLNNRLSRSSGSVRFTEIAAEDSKKTSKWNFKAGELLRFKLSYKVFENVPDLSFYMAFKSITSEEIITTFKKNFTHKSFLCNESSSVIVDLPENCLRPGEYSIYAWLGRVDGKIAYDVIDDNVGLPFLIISSEEEDQHKTAGFFSMPSKIFLQSEDNSKNC